MSPTPDDFPKFVKRMVATASKGYDFGADKLKATTAPMFFIHGDADGVRLAHIVEMFRLKGGETRVELRFGASDDPTLADSILDRLDIKRESLRKANAVTQNGNLGKTTNS